MSEKAVIPIERIAEKIYLIRDEKVMLDADLAELYGIETGALVRAMKRNIERFPEDFSFQLTKDEFENLKCQIGISSQWGGRRTPPYAFTEQGTLMLSSVLRSPRAVQVNIAIMRTFVRLREMLATNKHLARKVAEHDRQIANLYAHVERLLTPPKSKKNPSATSGPRTTTRTRRTGKEGPWTGHCGKEKARFSSAPSSASSTRANTGYPGKR